MASRDYIRHTVSSSVPTAGRLGDEYFNPNSNVLTKRVAINGKTVNDVQIPIVSAGNVVLTPTVTVNSGNVGIGLTNPAVLLDVSSKFQLSNTVARFSGFGLFQGIAVQSTFSDSSNYSGLFFDARNETGACVANFLSDINQDGSSSWSWSTQSAGNRTDRRAERMRIDSSGNVGIGVSPTVTSGYKLQVNGVIADNSGNIRDLVNNTQGGAYVLALADNGKMINITTGGVTVPGNLFVAGNNITIYNNSAVNQTITSGLGITMYLAGTATTGNRTLAQRGLATVVCVAAQTFVISGAGLT